MDTETWIKDKRLNKKFEAVEMCVYESVSRI